MRYFLVLLLWGTAYMLQVAPRPSQAQQSTWRTPTRLYSSDGEVGLRPLLLSDRMGRLHLFWNEIESEDADQSRPAIFYMVKDGDQWSKPIDVLTQPQGRMDFPRGVIDPYGRIHILYGGLSEFLTYSHSRSTDPRSAQDWTPPLSLAQPPQVGGDITLGVEDELHVAYGMPSGLIYHLTSTDWGRTWSAPDLAISSSFPDATIAPGGVFLRSSPDGTLHLVWNVVAQPGGYPPLGAFYARSTDDGQSWSEPVEIAPPDHMVTAILTDGNGQVHILYTGRVGVGGRYHRWSSDAGRTWSSPLPLSSPAEGSGLSGGDLAMDSSGRVHAVFGLGTNRIIAYSQWDGGPWSRWRNIAQGVPGGLEGMTLEITRGAELHAVWEADHRDIWYAEGQTSAPMIPVQTFVPLPTMKPTPTPIIMPTEVAPTPVQPTITPAGSWETTRPQANEIPPSLTLLIGATSSLLVIGCAVIWQLSRRKRG